MWKTLLKCKTKGCFSVDINPDNEWDIMCSLLPGVGDDDIPKEQGLLFHNVEETSSYISTLKNTKTEIKKRYLDELLSLARIGLTGENPTPMLSLETLDRLKDKIRLKEGSRIKNEYMLTLGKLVLLGILILFVINCFLHYKKIYYLDKYFYVSFGALIGTWISFGARKLNLSFEELSIIEYDGLSPYMRLIYICICSNIILLFLSSGIIEISLGGFNLNKIDKLTELQFILGVICGLVEYKIGIGLFNKANDILKL